MPRHIDPAAPLAQLARGYLDALLARERHRAAGLVMQALHRGTPLREVYLHVFQPVQYEVGWLWETGSISVGLEHYCTNATQLVMATLYPRLFQRPTGGRKLVVACVEGELHELGARMLADFFEMDDWDSCFLGANTPDESIVSTLEETSAALLAVSATMHSNVGKVARLIERVRRSSAIANVPILVGGYTFRMVDDLWRKVGADGTAADARLALELCAQLFAEE
jgi:methanogenic corrinoid protein MtbC1